MKYIALTGHIASGKTAVAQELVRRGYLLISYTDLLKSYVARALTAIGIETTVKDILADKERYRGLIQEMGTAIGFDQGGKYVTEALAEWFEQDCPKAVFDNVRTDEQATAVRELGFTVVELRATSYTRYSRLIAAGKNPATVLMREGHRIERGLSDDLVELTLTTDNSTPQQTVDFLETLPVFEGHPDDTVMIEEEEEMTHA